MHARSRWIVLVVSQCKHGDHHDSASNALVTHCCPSRDPGLRVREEAFVGARHLRVRVVDSFVVQTILQSRHMLATVTLTLKPALAISEHDEQKGACRGGWITYCESSGRETSQELYHDIDSTHAPRETAEYGQADGDGRVHVRARDTAADVDAEHEGEAPSPTGSLVGAVLRLLPRR